MEVKTLVMGRDGSYIARGVIRFPAFRYSMPKPAPPQDAVSVIAQEFIVDEPCALSVDVPGSYTYLRPGSENDRVEVEISVTGCPPERAEAILDRMKVGTQQMKDTVRVYSDGNRSDAEWWRWIRTLDVTVHINLKLPSLVEADLRAPGGEIDIANLEGHIDLKMMSGTCRAANLQGNLDIRAESSEVFIEDFSGEQIVARVAVGSLTLENVESDVLSLRSVSAPVQIKNVAGATSLTANSTTVEIEDLRGPSTIRSQGGPVHYHSQPTEESELTVVGSTLNVHLPSDHGAHLSMTGAKLSIDEDFSFSGEQKEHKIEGALNDGGPTLDLRAVGGTAHCKSS